MVEHFDISLDIYLIDKTLIWPAEWTHFYSLLLLTLLVQ